MSVLLWEEKNLKRGGKRLIKKIGINPCDPQGYQTHCFSMLGNGRYGKIGQNFLIWSDLTWKIPDPTLIFFTWIKNRLTCDSNHFLKLLFLGKKIIKLRQYWLNYLLWTLRKQLRSLHNCMQMNWKMNGWDFL